MSLHLTPSDGGPDIVYPAVGRYTLSPDGTLLAFNDGYCGGPSYGCGPADAGIERAARISAGGPVAVGPGSAATFSGGAEVFSPDNSRILYAAQSSSPYPLVIAKTDGSGSQQLAANINGCSIFGFSPDSQYALYAVPGTVTCDLLSVPVGGGSSATVGMNINTNSLGGGCGGLCPGAWLFAGNSVIYIDGLTSFNGTGTLKVRALGGGAATTIASNVNRPVYLSSDAGQVVFGVGAAYPSSSLYLSNVTNPVPRLVGNTGRFGEFSPDGTRVLLYTDCAGNCTLNVLTLSTGTIVVLASDVGSAKWAPNGQTVAFVTNAQDGTGTLQFAPATGGTSTVVADRAQLLGWINSNVLLGRRAGVPAPFSFQNGLYVFPVP